MEFVQMIKPMISWISVHVAMPLGWLVIMVLLLTALLGSTWLIWLLRKGASRISLSLQRRKHLHAAKVAASQLPGGMSGGEGWVAIPQGFTPKRDK